MSTGWRDPDVRAGAGVLGVAALLLASLAWWFGGRGGEGETWFTEYADVEGLAVSAPVQLGGYAIGRVVAITPTAARPGAPLRYRVALRLDDPSVAAGVARPTAGMTAHLVPAPVVGAGLIMLKPGEPVGAALPPGATIPGTREPLILDEMRRTAATLTQEAALTAQAVRVTLDSMTRTAGRLAGRVDGVLAQADPTLAEVRATLARAQGAMASADTALRAVTAMTPDVAATLDSVRALSGTTNAALLQAQRELARQSPRFDRIIAQLDTSSVAMTFLMRKFAQRPMRLIMGVDPKSIPAPAPTESVPAPGRP